MASKKDFSKESNPLGVDATQAISLIGWLNDTVKVYITVHQKGTTYDGQRIS